MENGAQKSIFYKKKRVPTDEKFPIVRKEIREKEMKRM